MSPAPIRRWNPGFIALRWRHPFWGLPLIGLLAGLIVHFLPMIRNTATGVVEPTGEPSDVTARPPFERVDVVRALESDKVLLRMREKLDLPNRWQLDGEECLRTLRSSITSDQIQFRGNTMVAISVASRSREESETIWHVLVTELKNHLNEARSLHDQALLDLLERRVELEKAEVESKSTALREALQVQMSDSHHHVRTPINPVEIDTLKDELEKSQASLETFQIGFISKKLMVRAGYISNALWVVRTPGQLAPATLWDTLRPLVLHSSFGFGSGMVLAVILVYLLELLFPRKQAAL